MSWKRFRPWFRKTKERSLNWPGRLRPALFSVLSVMLVLQGCVTVSQSGVKVNQPDKQSATNQTNQKSATKSNSSQTKDESAYENEANPDRPDVNGGIDPLRGIASATQLGRPIQIMVENSPQSRPQTGLELADVIYEILAEGEITRFAAIYHSKQPSVIGPVRSIRPYFVEIGAGIQAVIVHAGWSQDAAITMKKLKVDHFDQVYGDEAYYWRDKSRRMPHNLYTGIDRILKGMAAKKKKTDWTPVGWQFAANNETFSGGETVTRITIPYQSNYTVQYEWNETHQRFARKMNNKFHTDRVTSNNLMAANVLIAQAPHKILDKQLRREVNIKGPGKGWLAQRGKIIPIKWQYTKGFIRAFDANGVEYQMQPGQTWIQVVPMNTKVTWK